MAGCGQAAAGQRNAGAVPSSHTERCLQVPQALRLVVWREDAWVFQRRRKLQHGFARSCLLLNELRLHSWVGLGASGLFPPCKEMLPAIQSHPVAAIGPCGQPLQFLV